MEQCDDDEEAAQLSVTPDGTPSQSGDQDESEAEQQQTSKKTGNEQAEDAAERAERRIYEDEVLERARTIEKARAASSKACPYLKLDADHVTQAFGTDSFLQPHFGRMCDSVCASLHATQCLCLCRS